MKGKIAKWWLSIGVTVGLLALVWAVSTALAQAPGGDAPVSPAGSAPVDATGGGADETHAFSYQGRLIIGGQPANGNYDFYIYLYTAETGGVNLGTCDNVNSIDGNNNQPVMDGIFTLHLVCAGWNSDVFTGGSRWLEVWTRPTGTVTWTLLGRQPISPTPYAWSLYPGAIISSTVYGGSFGDALLNIHNNNTVSTWSAFHVDAASGSAVYAHTNGTALYGVGGTGNGVEGHSTSGTGGYFYSSLGTGIMVMSNGSGHWNHAGYFSAWKGYGILARSLENMAIRGEAGDVSGLSQPAGPVGVVGIGDRGVWGGGDYQGVYGTSNSDSGYGGYFDSSAANGVALYAQGSGSGRYKATLRVNNYESSGGMAAYLTNGSDYHTAHFYSSDVGGVLYLQNGGSDASGTGGGDFITAVNEPESDAQFRVLTNGEVRSDVGFYTPAADFAEMLPAVEGLEPGDVLVIGPDGQLARSGQVYQSTVVGVYSTRPGFVGGQPVDGELEGYAPLAIVGLVPVKASAENGPIQPGDLLTTSSTPGHAMRAGPNPPVGSVIGKALQPLDAGTGVIQLLVLLQ